MRRIVLMLFLWASVALVSLTYGAADLGLAEIFDILAAKFSGTSSSASGESILLRIRLPRVLLAGVVGASLALAGTALQGLFRNPMASPYVLGISAGAALGAVAAMVTGFDLGLMFFRTAPLVAFLGALLSTLLVYSLARVKGRVPVATLLLAGVALGSFLSAVVSILLVFSEDDVAGVLFWLMGGLSGANWSDLSLTIPYFGAGLCLLVYYSRDLNALLLGEEASRHLGIEVEKVKKRLLLATSLLTAAAVAVTGIIGFVGLIVPHIVRLFTGPDHRVLVPMSALTGALLVTVMDTVARTALAPAQIPVGVISALLGGPFFIFLLRRRRMALY